MPDPKCNPDVATRFLTMAWGETFPGFPLIFRLPSRSSHFLTRPDAVVGLIRGYGASENLYMGVGLTPLNYPGGLKALSARPGRGNAADIGGLCGLWLDIDIADPLHKRPDLPPDLDSAMSLLHEMPDYPTGIVHSGHGIQAWWLFETPWLFAPDSAESRQAADLAYSWNKECQRVAATHGWTVDSVFDLARVLRLPGTLNLKDPKAVKPVTIIDWDGPRLAQTAIFDRIPMLHAPDGLKRPSVATGAGSGDFRQRGGAIEIDGVILDETAEPPADRFTAIYENPGEFRATWENKRPDMADQSASAYDLSLATQAAHAGWTDPEIAALLIARRRSQGQDYKFENAQYYARTIAKAKESVSEDTAAIRRMAWEPSLSASAAVAMTSLALPTKGVGQHDASLDAPQSPDPEDEFPPPLKLIRRELGIPLLKIYKRGKEKPEYEMVMQGHGTIYIGDGNQLFTQKNLSMRLLDSPMRFQIANIKPNRWRLVVDAMVRREVMLDIPVDNTERSETIAWLHYALEYQADCRTLDDFREWLSGKSFDRQPTARYEDRVWLVTERWRTTLAPKMIRITTTALAMRLSRLDTTQKAEAQMFTWREGAKSHCRKAWDVNPAWTEEAEGDEM